jgi:hypothetical protein
VVADGCSTWKFEPFALSLSKGFDRIRANVVKTSQGQSNRIRKSIFGDKDMSNANDNQPVVWAVLVAVIVLAVGLALGFGVAKSKKPATAAPAATVAAPAQAASEAASEPAAAASEASAAK